ncbi:MAG: hypothetical protein JWM47_3621, partial [Acidimicrobiales bacterium]|nr:hypothetical protein [Acidimicrobiales bacterium]
MLAVLVALALVAVALAVATVLARRDLGSCRAELATSRTTSAEAEAARDRSSLELDAARAELAEQRRAGAEAAEAAARAVAEAEAARGAADQGRAEAEASLSEAAILTAHLFDEGAADPAALWAMELLRSERTWRHDVAAVADDPSPLEGARHPLWTALEVEVASVREEIGAVVDLDVDLPELVPPAASLAVL